jgi:AmmeMemoRadiSam system protein A
MNPTLSAEDRQVLLSLARQSLTTAVTKGQAPPFELHSLSPTLQNPGASFVTLTRRGSLRGCIGAIEAYQPLALDVYEHAAAAALNDFRFPPVTPEELPEIEIEISYLTPPQPLAYSDTHDLLAKLRPGMDGVVLRDGWRRATFLPQVWEKLPDPAQFLDHLCSKMGAAPDTWRHKKLDVLVYQVEEFHEAVKPPSQ